MAGGRGIRPQLNVIVREMVALWVLKRQFDVAQVRIRRDIHG